MCSQCQLAFQRDKVVDVNRLIDIEYLLPLDKQLDKIFACRDILSYKLVDGVKKYGKWSAVKKVKITK